MIPWSEVQATPHPASHSFSELSSLKDCVSSCSFLCTKHLGAVELLSPSCNYMASPLAKLSGRERLDWFSIISPSSLPRCVTTFALTTLWFGLVLRGSTWYQPTWFSLLRVYIKIGSGCFKRASGLPKEVGSRCTAELERVDQAHLVEIDELAE